LRRYIEEFDDASQSHAKLDVTPEHIDTLIAELEVGAQRMMPRPSFESFATAYDKESEAMTELNH
jgi:hypothetical protein